MLDVVAFGAICELSDAAGCVTHSVDEIQPATNAGEDADDKNHRKNELSVPVHAQRPDSRTREYQTPYHVTLDEPGPWPFKRRNLRTMAKDSRDSSSRKGRRSSSTVGVLLSEFADLSDGTRVILRNDRGFSLDLTELDHPEWPGRTPANLEDRVVMTLLPVDKEYYSQRYYSPEEIARRVRRSHGIEIDPESVRAATPPPLVVEFGSDLFGPDWPGSLTQPRTKK